MDINIADIWEFVSKYYPDYGHSDRIAYSDDLQCILDGQEMTESKQRVFDMFNGDLEAIQVEYDKVHREIYEMSIQAYLNSLSKKTIKVHVVFGEDKSKSYGEIGLIAANFIEIQEFNTQAEADAYTKGLEDSNGWMDYAVIVNPETESLYEFQGMKGYFNPQTGMTYQKNDVCDTPAWEIEPVNLDDIEVPDWWLSLTDDDYQLICKYYAPLKFYTKELIYWAFNTRTVYRIEQIAEPTNNLKDCFISSDGVNEIWVSY